MLQPRRLPECSLRLVLVVLVGLVVVSTAWSRGNADDCFYMRKPPIFIGKRAPLNYDLWSRFITQTSVKRLCKRVSPLLSTSSVSSMPAGLLSPRKVATKDVSVPSPITTTNNNNNMVELGQWKGGSIDWAKLFPPAVSRPKWSGWVQPAA